MRQTTGARKSPGEKIVKDIKRATRKHYSSEEKIRIVLDGLRGDFLGNRNIFPNVINIEARNGCSLAHLVKTLYGFACQSARTYEKRRQGYCHLLLRHLGT